MIKSVDLAVFAGQSNMSGRGNASEAPECNAGYEYKVISSPDKLVPIKEPFGLDEDKAGGLYDRYDGGTRRTGSMVSAFVNEYYKTCHRQLVAVSASKGGTNTTEWLNGLVFDAAYRLDKAKKYLTGNEICIDCIFVVWSQGESDGDAKQSAEGYMNNLKQIFDIFKSHGAEKCFIIQTGHYNYIQYPDMANGLTGEEWDKRYKIIRDAQKALCEADGDFVFAASFEPYINDMKDRFHYNQSAYNAVGKTAGIKAGEILNNEGNEQ